MSTNVGWILVAVGVLLGSVAGGWITLRLARNRFDAQLRRVADEIGQRHSATIEQLRAAQVRAQTELEQSRNSFKRQLAVMAAEPRAALERAEDRLKAAYAELDRLRRGHVADSGMTELTDGFAATRPMHKDM